MKILVTGSTGLLGINTISSLLEREHEVVALARDGEKAKRVLPSSPRLQVWNGDLEAPDSWLSRLGEVDAVIHGAAYFREYFGRGDHAAKLRALNVELPVRLAQACLEKGVRKIVMVSSSLALGARADGTPADETDAPKCAVPESLYAASKVEMEAALAPFAEKLPIIIVRPGWMFGPNDHAPTSAGELVRTVVKTGKVQLVSGAPLEIADARDVGFGIVRALETAESSTIYNLAGNALSAASALREIARQAGGRAQIVPLPLALMMSALLEIASKRSGKPNPIPRIGLLTLSRGVPISSAKAQRELGVSFRPFGETARDTVAFFRA